MLSLPETHEEEREMRNTGKVAVITLLLLTASITLISCGTMKRDAIEGDTILAIAAMGPVATLARDYLVPTLEFPVDTPQREHSFYTRIVPMDSMAKVTRWQNIVMMGTLDGGDKVSKWLVEHLSEEALEGVRSGEHVVFRRENLWVNKQMVVFVVASDVSSLRLWLVDNSDVVYTLMDNARRDRRKKQLYARYEQKALSDSLQKAYGWHLRIPLDYKLIAHHQDPNYVRLRRWYPDRFLTVAWQFGTADDVVLDTLLAMRDRFGATFADPQKINRDFIKSSWVQLDGREALRVEGLWETIGPLGGGPFITYLLFDNETVYLIDGMVFAPDRAKEPYLGKLDIILNSFRP